MAGNNNHKRPAEYYMSLEYPITIIPQNEGVYIIDSSKPILSIKKY